MNMPVDSVRWPLVGRAKELATFTKVWADPRCSGLVISGPAGVGKSRLAEECLAQAVRLGFEGGRATASAAAHMVPLGAIAHLLPPGVDFSDPVQGFAEIMSALTGVHRHKWALMVDDLHLLDAVSTLLLRQLIEAKAVRLICVVRTGEPLTEAVQALCDEQSMHPIELADLERHQSDDLVRTILGGPVGSRTLRELYEASDGNVLYLHELVLGATAAGTLTSDGEIWELAEGHPSGTPRLAELVGARLAAAHPAGRPVLELLALCEPLPLADAQAVIEPDALEALKNSRLIRMTSDQRRTMVTLEHPLYGEVLRTDMALRGRAMLLDQVERTLAHGARRRDDALHIAIWRLAATGTADPELLTRAAVLARHAHDYQQVVALLEALPQAERSYATLLMLGEAYFQMGRWERAEEVLVDADTAAADEQETLAVTLARASSLLWSNASFTAPLAVNNAALDRIANPVGRHLLRINEGFLRIVAGQPLEGLVLLESLEADAADAADINAWLRGALMKPAGLAAVGRADEAVALAEHAYAVHLQVDERALVSHPAVQRIPFVFALTESGRLTDARREGEKVFAELAVDGTLVQVWMAVFLGRMEWLSGHPVASRHWWAEAAALARAINHAKVLRLVLAGLAASAALLGDLAAAENALSEHRTLPPLEPVLLSAGEERLGEAWLLAVRGRLGEARTVLTEAARAARRTGHITSEALLLTDVARLGGAKEVRHRLAELAHDCDGTFVAARAHLAEAMAADDPQRLLATADELEKIGADLLAAEAASASSAAWRRAGQPHRAATAAHRAQVLAARCQEARTPLLTTAKAAAVLTAREHEIALLAAAGVSSKDIAAALKLSPRTVDNHLQHAYTKLGVATRRELADTLEPKTG
ncbi:LuxR C-terminal-related transcriptional regulator [Streptomyces sp. NPDC060027]|uniref:helix-turn-helix transcriptional regulator n=1 Tax=Streptomyces sp. NPDC060027 TaxID=3347040 RepID=UPI003697F1AB